MTALMGYLFAMDIPSTIPSVTGANRSTIAGKYCQRMINKESKILITGATGINRLAHSTASMGKRDIITYALRRGPSSKMESIARYKPINSIG